MAYLHREIEKKWQDFWEENKTFSVNNPPLRGGSPKGRGSELQNSDEQNSPLPPLKEGGDSQKKFYALDMFPYPSGAGLHVGHPEGYTATDIICRKKRMEGYKVLHPMGWDAFGLPAENFAIKTGVHPNISTQENIKNFTRQIKSLGFSYDWDREIDTTDPKYYKWTQQLFLKFYEKGLLYEEEKPMNWCPSCKVVCANEEVEQGLHERCGNVVAKKSLKQWMFKITDYAERLLQDLEKPNVIILHGWGGKGSSGWMADLKKILEQHGVEFFAPDLPNTQNPKYEEWKDFFEQNLKKYLRRNTILVGHSLGCGFFQRYLTEENVRVGELVFVAPTVTDCGIPEIANFFTKKFDYEKIKNSADNIFIFGGGKDCYISEKEFQFLAEKLSAHFQFFPECGHWGQGSTPSNPEILAFFEKIVASQLDWPEKIKAMQKNWIGKSTGLLFTSPLVIDKNHDHTLVNIQTYSTHFEAFYADTFVVIAPDHPLLAQLLEGVKNREEIEQKCKEMIAKREVRGFEEEKESDGIFTGRYIADPIGNGNLPIWVASYALADYGTGIVKCSCHDERDFAFAKKFNIALKPVLFPKDTETAEKVKNLEICYTDMKNGFLAEPSEFAGKKAGECREAIVEFVQEKGFAVPQTNYRLRDWIFTRQRYWGEPIPLVFDEDGKCYPLDESELPLVLPESANYEPSENGESPLAKIDSFVNVKGYVTEKGTVRTLTNGSTPLIDRSLSEVEVKNFRRETSTMPNWAGSSWYWLRFMDTKNDEKPWNAEAEKFWGPVDLYVGGAEHAVLHLLYARFWHKALYDMGLVSTKEPFKKLVNQGLILSYAYQNENSGLVPTDEVEEKDGKFFAKDGKELKKIVAKMSKSLKNVVNPDEIVEAFGADTLRMYEMFMGPFEQSKAWDTSAVEGMHKFLARIHRNFTEKEIVDVCPPENLVRLTHQTVKKVSDDIEEFKFNTAISQLMIWMNEFAKLDHIPRIAGGRFVRILSPFAPHLAEELWQKFLISSPSSSGIEGEQKHTIAFAPWPSYEEKYLVSDTATYAVQVNGKLRADFEMPKDATKEEVLEAAKKLEKVQKYLAEGTIRKEIFVEGKIVGFVVN